MPIILTDAIAFFKPAELSHFKIIKPFWPTVIVALVDPSIVCIIEPFFSVRRGILAGDILTNSPESIFPRFSPAIVIKGSLEFTFAILAKIISPVFNFKERSSLDAE